MSEKAEPSDQTVNEEIFTTEKLNEQRTREDPTSEWDGYFNEHFPWVIVTALTLYYLKGYLGRKYDDVQSSRLRGKTQKDFGTTNRNNNKSMEEIKFEAMQRAREKQQESITAASRRDQEIREQHEKQQVEEKEQKMREFLAEKQRFRLGTTPEAEGIGKGYTLGGDAAPDGDSPVTPPTATRTSSATAVASSPVTTPQAAPSGSPPSPPSSPQQKAVEEMSPEEIEEERKKREEEMRAEMRRVRERQQAYITQKTKEDKVIRDAQQAEAAAKALAEQEEAQAQRNGQSTINAGKRLGGGPKKE